MPEETDEFGIPIKKAPATAEVDEFGIPVKKKEPTNVSPATSSNVSQTVGAPLSGSGEKDKPLEYTWGSGLKTPLSTGTEGTSPQYDAFQKSATEALSKKAVKKQDEVIKNSAELKQQEKVLQFADQYPEVKELAAIEKQLTDMGKVTKPEDIAAFNALVDKRNQLLDKEITNQEFGYVAPADLTMDDFATPTQYYNYLKEKKEDFTAHLNRKQDFETISPQLNSKKLKDVVVTAQAADVKRQELDAKIKADQAEADAAIKEVQTLNQDKLKPLGFVQGFAEGMEQTTLSNTVADLYISGNEPALQKALENLYSDSVMFPRENTTGGDIGETLGGQVKPMAVGIGSAVVSEVTTGQPFAGIAAGSAYYGRMGIGSGLMDGYVTARSQGYTQTEAYNVALSQAKAGGIGGAVEGAVAAIPFLGKPISKIATETFKKAVVNGLKDNGIDAVVAGISQVAQNKNLQRLGLDVETSRGVAENMAAEFVLGSAINLAFYGGAKIKPKDYKAILIGLSEMPFQDIQLRVDEAVKAGVLDEAKAGKTMTDLLKTKAALDAMPQNLTPQQKLETTPIVEEIQTLQKEVANAGATVPTETTEAKIEQLQDEFNEKTGAPLTFKEQKEYEKLIEKRDAPVSEGAPKPKLLDSEKAQIEHYEKRTRQAGKNEANKIATDAGYQGATHLLNSIKKNGLGEFDKVQDVPKKIFEQLKEKKAQYEAGDVVELESTVTETKVEPETEAKPVDELTEKLKQFPLPDKPVTEMNSAELFDYAKKIKEHDKRVGKVDEDTLTPEQSDLYYGKNLPDGVYDPTELTRMGRLIEGIETADNASQIGQLLRRPLLQYAKNKGIEDLGIIKAAAKKLTDLGASVEDVLGVVQGSLDKQITPEETDMLMKAVVEAITPNEAAPQNIALQETNNEAQEINTTEAVADSRKNATNSKTKLSQADIPEAGGEVKVGDYTVKAEAIEMPDGEAGMKVSITKPDGEVVDLGNNYTEDVATEVNKKLRGFDLAKSEKKVVVEVKSEVVEEKATEKVEAAKEKTPEQLEREADAIKYSYPEFKIRRNEPNLTREEYSKLRSQTPVRGKDLIAEGLDELVTALGGKKNIISDERKPRAITALAKIGRGLMDEGAATIDNIIESIKAYIKKNGGFNQDFTEADFAGISNDVKKKIAEINQKSFLETVKDAPSTTEGLEAAVKDMDNFYEVITNKESLAAADKKIAEDLTAAKDFVLSDSAPSAEKSAMAVRLIKHYEKAKDFDSAIEILDAYDKQLREAGRFVQAASLWNRLSPETVLRTANKEAERLGQKLSPEVQKEILNRMGEVDKMPEGTDKDKATMGVLNYIAEQMPYSKWELLDAYRYQNMLSNPRSHLRNIYGNLFNVFVTEPLSLATRSGYDMFKDQNNPIARDAKFSQIPQYYKDVFTNIPNAWAGFAEAFKNGYVADKIMDIGSTTGQIEALRRAKLPKYLTVATRFLEAQDRFFSIMIGQGEKLRLMRDGMGEAEANDKATKLAQEYLYRDSMNASDKTKLHSIRALDAVGNAVNGIRKVPYFGKAAGWFAPFVTTPINVVKLGVKFSPLAAVEIGAGKIMGKDYSTSDVANATIGSVLTGMGAMMAAQGLTTWAAPQDKKEKELFYASGRKPYSVKIGETWVPMSYMGPFALTMAIPAATKHFHGDTKTALTDSEAEKIKNTILGISKYLGTQTSLSGVGSFIETLTGNDDYNIEKSIGNLGNQLVPAGGFVRYINSILDPVYRKTKTATEAIQSGIPTMSNELEAYKTIDGKDAKREPLNYALPYDLGFDEEGYGTLLKTRREKMQKKELEKKENEGKPKSKFKFKSFSKFDK